MRTFVIAAATALGSGFGFLAAEHSVGALSMTLSPASLARGAAAWTLLAASSGAAVGWVGRGGRAPGVVLAAAWIAAAVAAAVFVEAQSLSPTRHAFVAEGPTLAVWLWGVVPLVASAPSPRLPLALELPPRALVQWGLCWSALWVGVTLSQPDFVGPTERAALALAGVTVAVLGGTAATAWAGPPGWRRRVAAAALVHPLVTVCGPDGPRSLARVSGRLAAGDVEPALQLGGMATVLGAGLVLGAALAYARDRGLARRAAANEPQGPGA